MNSIKEIMAAGLKALEEHPAGYVAISAQTCELVAYGPDLKDVHERALAAGPRTAKCFFWAQTSSIHRSSVRPLS